AAVDRRCTRQAEDAGTDAVALDLVGATGDARLEAVEHDALRLRAGGARRVPRHRAGSGELERHRADAPRDVRAEQVAQRTAGTGSLAGLALVTRLHRDERLRGLHRPDLHQLIADHRVVDPAGRLGRLAQHLEVGLVDLARTGAADGHTLVHQ